MTDQDKINAFTVAIIDHFFFNDACDIDSEDFSSIAIEHGVMERFKPSAPCCLTCGCAEVYDIEDFEAGRVECNRGCEFLDGFRKKATNETK
jgi:hypothetical protein